MPVASATAANEPTQRTLAMIPLLSRPIRRLLPARDRCQMRAEIRPTLPMSSPNEPTSSTRHPRFIAASIACFIVSLSASTSAQPPMPAPEAIRVQTEGAVRCTTADDFFARVHRRAALTRLASTDERARSFSIAVEGSEPALHGRLAITHLDGTSSTRDVEGESCDEVVDALALITAIDIDPRAVAPQPEAQMPPVVPIVTGPTPPREEPRDNLPPLQLRAGASFSVAVGIAPV